MASCSTSIDTFLATDASLDVSSKYKQLMEDSLGEGSFYERVKDTFAELFQDFNISEAEKIQLISANITQLSLSLSSQAMNTALMWEKEERDGAYQLAMSKAQTELVHIQKEMTKEQICKLVKETEQTEAQTAEILASTIRNDALNAKNIEMLESQKYTYYADAYRKSGIVEIGTGTDGIIKGLSGDNAGYTYKQDKFIDRQVVSFEDSKRSHAANSSSQMIGQLLSAEVPIEESDTAFVLWKSAMEYLNQDS